MRPNMKILLLVTTLLILSSCSVLREANLPYDPIEEECKLNAADLIGSKVIVTVDSKTYPPQHGSVMPSCTFDFPESKIDFEKVSSCNTIPGSQIGENKNYLYGSLGVTGKYLKRKITNENGTIIGNEGIRFRLDFYNIDQNYPNDVNTNDPIYHIFEFNVTNITFYECSLLFNTTSI